MCVYAVHGNMFLSYMKKKSVTCNPFIVTHCLNALLSLSALISHHPGMVTSSIIMSLAW